jgi:hypothetical protein
MELFPLSPERELILRIVEQWGNVMSMPKMDQWLKDYANTKNQQLKERSDKIEAALNKISSHIIEVTKDGGRANELGISLIIAEALA